MRTKKVGPENVAGVYSLGLISSSSAKEPARQRCAGDTNLPFAGRFGRRQSIERRGFPINIIFVDCYHWLYKLSYRNIGSTMKSIPRYCPPKERPLMKSPIILGLTFSLLAANVFAMPAAEHTPLGEIAPVSAIVLPLNSLAEGGSDHVIKQDRFAQDGSERTLNRVAQDGSERTLNRVAQDGSERTLNRVAEDGSDHVRAQHQS
jgi:hypothetical protein